MAIEKRNAVESNSLGGGDVVFKKIFNAYLLLTLLITMVGCSANGGSGESGFIGIAMPTQSSER